MAAKKTRRKTAAPNEATEVQEAPAVTVSAVDYKVAEPDIASRELTHLSCWKSQAVADVCLRALPATVSRSLVAKTIDAIRLDTNQQLVCAEVFAQRILEGKQ